MFNKLIKGVVLVFAVVILLFGSLKLKPIFAETYTQVQTWINSYGDPNLNDDKLKVLADLQPGLGVIMQEIGRRFTAIYFACRAGNWDLANYELKELREAQEVGEITRPKRKEALISFEEEFLGSAENPKEGTLQDAINKKNFLVFNRSFKSAIGGCNDCHKSTGFSYIKYKLPKSSELPLEFFLEKEK